MNGYKNANTKLIDIATVNVDKNLPQTERVKEFKRQIANLSNYECEGFVIQAYYATNGDHIEDCLRGIKA